MVREDNREDTIKVVTIREVTTRVVTTRVVTIKAATSNRVHMVDDLNSPPMVAATTEMRSKATLVMVIGCHRLRFRRFN